MTKLIATLLAATAIIAMAGCTNHEVRQATAVQHHLTISQAQYEQSGWNDDQTVKTVTLIMTVDPSAPASFVDRAGKPLAWVKLCQTAFMGEPILDHGVAQCDMSL